MSNNSEGMLDKKSFFVSTILDWETVNYRQFPWRNLKDNPFGVLVAEILLIQTFAEKVAPVYSLLMQLYPTAYDLASAQVNAVEDVIRPLGLTYRASQLVSMSNVLIDKYSGKVPDDYDELIELRGVGSYVACSTLCFGFSRRVPIIDANVERVIGRFFDLQWPIRDARTRREMQKLVRQLLPLKRFQEYNYGLIDFAALVCRHRRPNCGNCYLLRNCSNTRWLA